MLTLILTRHAKSAWDDPAAADHARPLNDRGRRDAPRIGLWLAAQGHVPTEVICSDARRTRETLTLILPALHPAPQTVLTPALYHAGPAGMLAVLAGARGDKVLMIGHNPGIGRFAAGLVHGHPDHPRFRDYPTGATTVIAFDAARWADVRPGQGRAAAFMVPHDLAD